MTNVRRNDGAPGESVFWPAEVNSNPPGREDIARWVSRRVTALSFVRGVISTSGDDVSWINELDSVDTITIEPGNRYPALEALRAARRRSLLLLATSKVALPPEALDGTERLICRSPSLVEHGIRDITALRYAVISGVKDTAISVGDGCGALEDLTIEARYQSGVFAWANPPERLRRLSVRGFRPVSLEALGQLSMLEEVDFENAHLVVGGAVLDAAPLAKVGTLRRVGLVQTLPVVNVRALLDGNPNALVTVPKGWHDGPAGHPRLHEYTHPTKQTL